MYYHVHDIACSHSTQLLNLLPSNVVTLSYVLCMLSHLIQYYFHAHIACSSSTQLLSPHPSNVVTLSYVVCLLSHLRFSITVMPILAVPPVLYYLNVFSLMLLCWVMYLIQYYCHAHIGCSPSTQLLSPLPSNVVTLSYVLCMLSHLIQCAVMSHLLFTPHTFSQPSIYDNHNQFLALWAHKPPYNYILSNLVVKQDGDFFLQLSLQARVCKSAKQVWELLTQVMQQVIKLLVFLTQWLGKVNGVCQCQAWID